MFQLLPHAGSIFGIRVRRSLLALIADARVSFDAVVIFRSSRFLPSDSFGILVATGSDIPSSKHRVIEGPCAGPSRLDLSEKESEIVRDNSELRKGVKSVLACRSITLLSERDT